MPINIRTPGFHHVTLRSGNLERSKRFYSETLGFPIVMELPILVIFRVGTSVLVVRGNEPGTPPDDKFNPLRVGLDHLAMACEDEAELERVAAALSA
ncbi:MAG TPA: VOC family protein, partial [Pyrinomonadaceae bacterium]|nr:VOC family protein [Pyrinomonadaceae bacterium]